MKKPRYKGGAGKKYIYALDKLYSTQPRHNCKNCEILTHWKLCPSCVRWRQHFIGTRTAYLAMKERRQ